MLLFTVSVVLGASEQSNRLLAITMAAYDAAMVRLCCRGATVMPPLRVQGRACHYQRHGYYRLVDVALR